MSGETQDKKKRNFGPKEPPTIDVKDVLEMLEAGKSREEIGEHYGGLNQGQIKELFSHPKLLGKKTIKRASNAFVLVDTSGDDVPIFNDGKPINKKVEAATSTNGTQGVAVEQQPTVQPAQEPTPVAGVGLSD